MPVQFYTLTRYLQSYSRSQPRPIIDVAALAGIPASAGGQTVYFGDLGHHTTNLINHFKKNACKCLPESWDHARTCVQQISIPASSIGIPSGKQVKMKMQAAIHSIHGGSRKRLALVAIIRSEFKVLQGQKRVIRDANQLFVLCPISLILSHFCNMTLNIHVDVPQWCASAGGLHLSYAG